MKIFGGKISSFFVIPFLGRNGIEHCISFCLFWRKFTRIELTLQNVLFFGTLSTVLVRIWASHTGKPLWFEIYHHLLQACFAGHKKQPLCFLVLITWFRWSSAWLLLVTLCLEFHQRWIILLLQLVFYIISFISCTAKVVKSCSLFRPQIDRCWRCVLWTIQN